MQLTFKGGLHTDDCKRFTEDKKIVNLTPSKIMIYPMSQHIGAVLTPIVSIGDRVLRGQKIGDSDATLSAPVHSSVSGTVVAVEPRVHPNGKKVMSVVVENDFLMEEVDTIRDYNDYDKLSRNDKLNLIKDAGVVGLGGATFPTHIKLNPPKDKKVDTIILNGAECEPYLTSDYRVMLETPKLIFEGLKIMMDITGVKRAYIGIESNKPQAIKIMTEIAKNYDNVEVKTLKTKYPQGSEKHLIYAILKREVPSGKLPADAGCIVDNVDTACAIARAVKRREPVMSRVVTVAGSGVERPQNLRVLTGTSFEDVLTASDADYNKLKKIIMGGPMMGCAVYTASVPTVKGTSAILAFTDEELKEMNKEKTSCIRCGECVYNCPMHLMPLNLIAYAKSGDLEALKKFNIMDCIECGICSYYCQANTNPLQYIKTAKNKITQEERKK